MRKEAEDFMDTPKLLPEESSEKRGFLAPFSALAKRLRLQDCKFLLWCMLLPALLVFLIYLVRGMHPLGDGSVLVLDLNGQYVWFFEALRNFVRGDAELLYSFSRALGGEFMGIYAYYLASPLSYLVCLFPTDRMLEALLCLFLVKTALCGASFGFYMHKTAKTQNKLAIILFSTCYALSSYAIIQQHNTMWIDAVMWLPLITLGIESLIKHGSFKLYTVSLAVALFSNYYIGYMLCIWCAIYFFFFYFAHEKDVRNPMGEKFHFPRTLGRMAGYSLLAVGIAAAVILGAYYSLNFGKTTFSDPDWTLATKFDLLDFFYKLLPGSYDTVRPEGLPFLYCGMLALLLIPSYFLSRKYPIRQKLFSAGLLFLLFLCMSVSIIDLAWHGFQEPNWLNYRYSFMFSFFLCVLACRAFEEIETISFKVTAIMGGAIALLCIVLQKYTNGEYIDPNDFTCIYFSLILVGAYLALFGYFKKTDKPRRARNGLIILLCAELFLNGTFQLIALDIDVGYTSYSTYNDFLDTTRPIVEAVQESDDSFYRMEKTFFRKTNDNMALSMRGLSGSTSTLNKETIKLLNKMGYASRSHWSKYLGGTPVSDSLLGLKYIISDDTSYSTYYDVYKTDPKNGYIAYQNPYALSIAYGVSDDVLDFPLGFVPPGEIVGAEDETAPPTIGQDGTINLNFLSGLINSLKGTANDLLDIEESLGEFYEDAYNSPFERLNAMVSAMLGETETLSIFVPITDYEKDSLRVSFSDAYSGGEHGYLNENENRPGSVTYTVTLPVDAELYFNLPTNYPREVALMLSVNGEKAVDYGTFGGNETQRIISLGQRKAGDTLALEMTLTNGALYLLGAEQCFYYIDWTVFEDAMTRLSKNQFQITDYTESSFAGTYRASRKNDLVLTTIAYDNGWEVYVDGERVESEKAFGALLAFHVGGDAGEVHQIELVYRPRAVHFGLIVTLVSLLLFIALLVLDHFFKLGCKPQRPSLPATVGAEAAAEEMIPTEPEKDENDAGTSPPSE